MPSNRVTSSLIRLFSVVILAVVLLVSNSSSVLANHFRAGTMSWEAVEGEENTVLIKMQVGWTNTHGHIPSSTPIGSVVTNKLTLYFGDGQSVSGAMRVISRNATTNDVQTELVSIKPGEEEYTTGVLHEYAAAGDYVAYWGSSARESAENLDSGTWRNETLINIGGDYDGNSSPVTAVAAVVQVPDDQVFEFDLVGVDPDGDTVKFRYGTQDEFFNNGNDAEATRPTGLVLDEDGGITWDVTDETLDTTIGDRWQMTVMAEDYDEEDNVKSYVPLDFVFRISDASDAPPTLITDDYTLTVGQGESLVFTLTADDPDWEDGDDSPTVDAINPPSSTNSVWSGASSSTDGETEYTVTFNPTDDMVGDTYVVIFQATDDGGNATTKNVSISVTAEPAPTATPTPTIAGATPTEEPEQESSSGGSCHKTKAVAPSIFTIEAAQTSAVINFTPVPNYDNYLISYSTSEGAEEHSMDFAGTSFANQAVTIHDLLPNSTYYFKVRVQNGCAPGDWSSIKSAATITSQPSPSVSQARIETVSVETVPESTCTYTVQPGDTAWSLAEETLGDGNRYPEIVEYNSEKYPAIGSLLDVGWVLSFPCESNSESVPHSHDGDEADDHHQDTSQTNSVETVTIVVEEEGVPVGGVNVELHSDPQYGVTDEEGKVIFTKVPPGEHTLKLAYKAFAAEQKITIDEDEEEYSIKVSVVMNQRPWYMNWLPVVIGVLIAAGAWGWWFFGARKKKKHQAK